MSPCQSGVGLARSLLSTIIDRTASAYVSLGVLHPLVGMSAYVLRQALTGCDLGSCNVQGGRLHSGDLCSWVSFFLSRGSGLLFSQTQQLVIFADGNPKDVDPVFVSP